MITEKEVSLAIEECLRDPITANKRTVLADLIIIQDYLFGEPPQVKDVQQSVHSQSYPTPPTEQIGELININGDSEFLKVVNGRKPERVWRLVDELVEAVKILHPRMYTTFIDKIQDL